MATCDHDHAHRRELVANEQQDLTNTTTLHRREFAPALSKRFRRLKGLIRTTVSYENDALELSAAELLAAEPREEFQFEEDEEAVDEFELWLQAAIAQEILERVPLRRVERGQHYTASFVRSAYLRGIRGAERRLENADVEIGDSNIGATFQMFINERSIK